MVEMNELDKNNKVKELRQRSEQLKNEILRSYGFKSALTLYRNNDCDEIQNEF